MKQKFTLLFVSLISLISAIAQEATSKYKWEVTSKKMGEKEYQLVFKTAGSQAWELYAPNQTIEGVKMGELVFADTSILQPNEFEISSPVTKVKSEIFNTEVAVLTGEAIVTKNIRFADVVPAQLQGTLQLYYGKGDFFDADLPVEFNVDLEGGIESATQVKYSSLDIKNPQVACGDGDAGESKSLFTIFILGFLGGLIALLTPCVFPMIPVTVTFFTKKSGGKSKGVFNAVLYGFFILLIYVLITIPFHVFDSAKPEIFNNLSTNVWMNLIFFAIFLVFALSFFGLFEITLPASIANKADSKSGLGNIAGIFFMAGTLAIVSFSCTGPILGTLLVGSLDQGAWPLTVGTAGFGLALGLPFALFAMFPNWLQSLPKSGGWMSSVKIVLGFVELALAIKFLANADNVQQWGIVKREVFVGAWVIIGALTTLYLLGSIRFKGDAKPKRFSPIRIFFIVAFASITIYLIPGLFNSKYASLRLLSGFPPPISYSIYDNHVLHAKGIQPIHNDLDAAIVKSKAENKPILIDFTGWACVNCRRMEEKVWPDPLVDSLMRKEFVVLSLYVDERTQLPIQDRTSYVNSQGEEQAIITIGDKWTAFQKENFGAVSQPQYAIITADMKALTYSKFYTPNAKEFSDWLECGINAYRQQLNASMN